MSDSMEQLHTILDKNNYIINSYRDYFLSYYGNKSDFILSAILPYGLRITERVVLYIKESRYQDQHCIYVALSQRLHSRAYP